MNNPYQVNNPYQAHPVRVHTCEGSECTGCKRLGWIEGHAEVTRIQRTVRNIKAMEQAAQKTIEYRMEDLRNLWAALAEVLDHPSLEESWMLEFDNGPLHDARNILDRTRHHNG